jgi:hypothetical protein
VDQEVAVKGRAQVTDHAGMEAARGIAGPDVFRPGVEADQASGRLPDSLYQAMPSLRRAALDGQRSVNLGWLRLATEIGQ